MRDTPDKQKVTLAPLPPETRAVKMNEGSKKARKSAARLGVVQVLYQHHLNPQNVNALIQEFLDHRAGFEIDGDVMVPADPDMLKKIVNGVFEHREALDEIIKGQLAKKNKTEVDPILTSVLFAAGYELMAEHDIDTPIILADYMNVTHAFYEDGAPKMINAVLDSLAKALRS